MRLRTLCLTLCLPLAFACEAKDKAPAAPKPPPTPKAPAAPASKPASNPHGMGGPKAKPSAPFSGLVKLADGLGADAVKPTDVLFIMARESQGDGLAGRLVAVQRHGKITLPLRYEMSSKDVMVPGIPFGGPFIVMARLDRDGDPMTRGADDLYGNFATPVTAGQEGVHLVLKKGAPKTVRKAQVKPGAASQPAKGAAGAASQPARKMPAKAASQPARKMPAKAASQPGK